MGCRGFLGRFSIVGIWNEKILLDVDVFGYVYVSSFNTISSINNLFNLFNSNVDQKFVFTIFMTKMVTCAILVASQPFPRAC